MKVGAHPLARPRTPSSLMVTEKPVKMLLYLAGSTWTQRVINTGTVTNKQLQQKTRRYEGTRLMDSLHYDIYMLHFQNKINKLTKCLDNISGGASPIGFKNEFNELYNYSFIIINCALLYFLPWNTKDINILNIVFVW